MTTSPTLLDLGPIPEEDRIAAPDTPDRRAHHAPNGRFINPWPSYNANAPKIGFKQFLSTTWLKASSTVPVPPNPEDRPVKVVPLDFPALSRLPKDAVKATWIGHASWLIEFPSEALDRRGITLLLDPVFSDRMSPVSFAGPKRFTPPPCTVEQLPFVDAVAISHNHYDHLDYESLKSLWTKQKNDSEGRRTRFFLPLKNKAWLSSSFSDIPDEDILDLDWWEGKQLSRGEERLSVLCTPSQHGSARSVSDRDQSLWSSWLFTYRTSSIPSQPFHLFFAGDTGYRNCPLEKTKPLGSASSFPGPEVLASLPHNPTFKAIGDLTKGVDMALLPIGCFNPVEWLSNVHSAPWDAVDMHSDLRSRTSIAMHYGVLRGGVSAAYEPIDMPTKELRAACERSSITTRLARTQEAETGKGEFVTCNVGETVYCKLRE